MEQLLADIEGFLADERAAGRRMSDSYFGLLAARDTTLLGRLRNGKRVWPEKEEEVRTFMSQRREASSKAA